MKTGLALFAGCQKAKNQLKKFRKQGAKKGKTSCSDNPNSGRAGTFQKIPSQLLILINTEIQED
jgi:hypothetical protein